MTHDPMCPQAYPYGRDDDLDSFFGKRDWDCRCDLIALVRADQREACIEEIASFYASGDNTEYWRGFDNGLAKSISLLKMGRNNG